MRTLFFIALISFILAGCWHKATTAEQDTFTKNLLPKWNRELTSVIMGDVLSPPVCSRIYAYTNIAAYEAILPDNKKYQSFAGRLNGLTPIPKPDATKPCNYRIASIIAFLTVGKKLVFNGQAVDDKRASFLHQLDSVGFDKTTIDNSVTYGDTVAQHIIRWISKDGYLQRTSFGGYVVTKEQGRWIPTPPDYMDATENNWRTLRPMTLDSCSSLRPGLPILFDTAKTSSFYKQVDSVYEERVNPNPQDSAIAWYWDDNPNTSITDGHITYFLQKVSPPGHWIYITSSVAEKENYDAVKTAHLLAETAVALYDGFISCWEAKFYYNYLRPETFINAHIDQNWQPLIQTPPFPEYPGGHGCISASAATVLTHLVGDNYKFTDSTEVPFGRPKRTFSSFYEAAAQANISRFYGGIHFPNSLRVGAAQGKAVGANVVKTLN